MPRWFRLACGAVAERLPAALSLVFLVAVAIWGASNGWQLPAKSPLRQQAKDEEQSDSEKTPTPEVEDDDAPAFLGGLAWSAAFPHGSKRIVFPSEAAVEMAGLQLIAAEERPMVEYVHANGMIDYDPATYAHLATRAAGTIWRVEKQIGQKVSKGEVLALVESAEVGKVKSDFLSSLAQYDVRLKLLQRMQEAGTSVAERILRESQAGVHESRIRLFSDQQALLNLGLAVRVEDLLKMTDEQRVRELRLLGLPKELKIDPQADTMTANLLPVAAPFDGQIVQRNAAIGEAVTSAKPLFVIADLRQVHLEVAVDPADVGKLVVGQFVEFTIQSGNTVPATGKLAHIGPEVDEKTRKVWVHAEADNPDGRLRPHSFGSARIVIHEEARAVVVPAEAIQSDADHHHLVFVRVSAEPVFHVRHVRTGLRSGDRIQVSGIRPGEEVVTTGSHALFTEIVKDRLGKAE